MFVLKGLPQNFYGPSVAMSLLIGLRVRAEKIGNGISVKVSEVVKAFRKIKRDDAAEFFARTKSKEEMKFSVTDYSEEEA